VLARFRGEALTHHSEVTSARPLKPLRRSIDLSQRGGQCSLASAAEAEHQLVTARRPVLARYRLSR
jgi:hypothetical protein